MTTQAQSRRRRFPGRQHAIDTRPPRLEDRIAAGQVKVVPDDVTWKVLPGDDTAHAFSAGPGWMRSCCREVRWTVLVEDEGPEHVRCGECAHLIEGSAS